MQELKNLHVKKSVKKRCEHGFSMYRKLLITVNSSSIEFAQSVSGLFSDLFILFFLYFFISIFIIFLYLPFFPIFLTSLSPSFLSLPLLLTPNRYQIFRIIK